MYTNFPSPMPPHRLHSIARTLVLPIAILFYRSQHSATASTPAAPAATPALPSSYAPRRLLRLQLRSPANPAALRRVARPQPQPTGPWGRPGLLGGCTPEGPTAGAALAGGVACVTAAADGSPRKWKKPTSFVRHRRPVTHPPFPQSDGRRDDPADHEKIEHGSYARKFLLPPNSLRSRRAVFLCPQISSSS